MVKTAAESVEWKVKMIFEINDLGSTVMLSLYNYAIMLMNIIWK